MKDASGKVVELKTLQPDGTYADPAELEAQAAAAEAGASEEPFDRRRGRCRGPSDYLVEADSSDEK